MTTRRPTLKAVASKFFAAGNGENWTPGEWIVRSADPDEFRWLLARHDINVLRAMKAASVRFYCGSARVTGYDEAVRCGMVAR